MRLIVAGGRDVQFPYSDTLVERAFDELSWKDEVTEIVHGGARGIDQATGRYFNGWKVVCVIPAKWTAYGKAAGPIRNRQMAKTADGLLAIWDGKSRGTKNMIEVAIRFNLRLYVYRYDRDGKE